MPIAVYLYDLLEYNLEDYRSQPLQQRRKVLEDTIGTLHSEILQLSTIISFEKWEELHPIRQNARSINSEGLMLKSKDSPYHTGRKRGDWWKWKIAPLTIDAANVF